MDSRGSRVSKQVMFAFQNNQFKDIRKANEMKKDYYPEGKGAGAAAVRAKKMNEEDDESDNI